MGTNGRRKQVFNMDSNQELLLHLRQQTNSKIDMEAALPTKVPQTFKEMWDVVKERAFQTMTWKGKTYTKSELQQLALKS